jgi:hypothetical protein
LDEVLVELLDLTSSAMGAAVELEIAVDMATSASARRGTQRKEPTLYTLQVRPFATRIPSRIDLEHIPADRVICRSHQALGNGQYSDLATVVYVKNDVFDRPTRAGSPARSASSTSGLPTTASTTC